MRLKKGFTLLEILLVIALIGILASIVLIAINPTRQLAQARNVQRQADIRTINEAITQYASREGEFPPGISNTYQDICPLGGGTNCVNLEVSLIPGYLSSIPIDPSGGNYQVAISAINGKLSIQSPNSELGQTIGTNTFVSGARYAGFNTGNPVGFDGLVNDIEIQNDGKVIIGGYFSQYQGTLVSSITRLNSNGSIDNSFNTGAGFNGHINGIVIQSDGKIVLGGNFTSYQGVSANRIIRLNNDGSIDNSFSIGEGFDSGVETVRVQSDGKIVVGGDFTTYQGVSANNIIRLNSDGSRDNTFNIGSGFDDSVSTISIQNDGKILIGGWFSTYQGVSANNIIRLNSDGSRDNSFNMGTGFDWIVNVIKTQSDGKILVGGWFSTYQGVATPELIRLNSDGSRDNSFNIGTGPSSGVSSIEVQSDGKIVVAGEFNSFQGVFGTKVVRINSDGTMDTSFRTNMNLPSTAGDVYTDSIAIQSNGGIIVGGDFYYNGFIIARNSDGSRDNSFNLGDGFDAGVQSVAVQSDGKILAVGNFENYQNTVVDNNIVRLNSDGSRDNGFNIGSGFDNSIEIVAVQNDGKILVGGAFTTYQGISANRIIRLNSDGSRDNTFNLGTGFNWNVEIIEIQSDGKIVVGGEFTTYQGVSANNIVRLNSNGSRDNPFSTGTGFSNPIDSIAVQSDGKILVGGNFTTYQGVSSNKIVRLNSDGSRDNTFNIGTGFDAFTIYDILINNDGKILVGGAFSSYQGVSANNIIRLNSDGSRDNGFDIGTGFNSRVHDILLDNNGKMLVGGAFSSYQGVSANNIIRLNSDGSRDNGFDMGTGFNGTVYDIFVQNDGKILVGGWFTNYQDQVAGYLITLIP